jgi:hypothetical protein
VIIRISTANAHVGTAVDFRAVASTFGPIFGVWAKSDNPFFVAKLKFSTASLLPTSLRKTYRNEYERACGNCGNLAVFGPVRGESPDQLGPYRGDLR